VSEFVEYVEYFKLLGERQKKARAEAKASSRSKRSGR